MWAKRLLGMGVLGMALLTIGCGDKEKEARSKAQQDQIAGLREQVELLTARLGTPEEGNPAEDLDKAKGSLDEATRKVEALRTELTALTKQRTDLEKEFEEYKRSYRIPE